MKTLTNRLEALEQRLAARHQLGKPTRQQLEDARRQTLELLERYATQAAPVLGNASFMEIIAHGLYEEAIDQLQRRGATQADCTRGWHMILIWEAHQRGISTDELIEQEIARRS